MDSFELDVRYIRKNLYPTVSQKDRVLQLRMMGLEPIRSHLRKILSLVRLPFRHIRLYSGTFSAPEQKIYYHRFLDLASLF